MANTTGDEAEQKLKEEIKDLNQKIEDLKEKCAQELKDLEE